MAATFRSGGLQHAASLGNIEASTKANIHQLSNRSYESEDENMGRNKAHPHASGHFPKTSVYSKGDIREQYCLSDRQLSSIERPRRERFFGCWSGRGAPQSFLGVCVGRRAPSDENLADYAPMFKYPRYPPPGPASQNVLLYDEDLESSYFRRRPTSFLTGGDPKRYTWMPADEEGVRLEGPRPICPEFDDFNRGPYVVGSYPPKSSFLSQSTEYLAGMYRCPAHIGLPPPPPPPTVPPDGTLIGAPRTKHVSFARSHTLTSFDEAMGMRPLSRLGTARSQERLIGGKKPTMTLSQQQLPPTIQQQLPSIVQTNLQSQQQQQPTEIVVIEKIKRSAMKTQATQTEVCLGRKPLPPHHLSLSPRTIHRVKMVSQGAQTNGGLNGRKLTKSLSEAAGRVVNVNMDQISPLDGPRSPIVDHEPLHRTQSEEPPRSPFGIITPPVKSPHDTHSRTSSRQSQIETSRSEPFSSENIFTHSRNHSQDSATSFRSTDIMTSKASQDSISFNFSQENIVPQRRDSHVIMMDSLQQQQSKRELEQVHRHEYENGHVFESHSLPRRTCVHHRTEDFPTYTLPRREHHHQQPCKHTMSSGELLNGSSLEGILKNRRASIKHDSSTDSNAPLERPTYPRRMSAYSSQENHVQLRRASHTVTPETHTSMMMRRSSMQHQVMMSQTKSSPSEEFCSTCESESDSRNEKEEKEIFIDFKPRLSPTPSPKTRKKRLQKTLSEGEILLEKRREAIESLAMTSASDEDLKTPEREIGIDGKYHYRSTPIKDEGIFDKQHLLAIPTETECGVRLKREAFRKRSISLEDPTLDDDTVCVAKSAPLSPCPDELSVHVQSTFPSTDSIANDLTRDHSDGIWNESQVTVLTNEQSPSDSGPSLLTPTSRRKNLLLQHQQRSSMDTEGIELEESPAEQSQAQTASAMTQTSTTAVSIYSMPKSTQPVSHGALLTKTTYNITVTTPSIAVTPSLSIEREDQEILISSATTRRSRPLSPSKRKEMKKGVPFGPDIEPLVHSPQRIPETTDSTISVTASDLLLNRSDSGKTNTDISEGSTNTEDYVTCTDNSKRAQGIKTSGASSSSTQVPVSAQSSQTVTADGSSFESASSIYSLARGDAICEDVQPTEEPHVVPISVVRPVKPSPTHSVSSSSSGSYSLKDRVKTSPSRATIIKSVPPVPPPPDKSESISDDDRSEKRYSSSGYYESPHDEAAHPVTDIKVSRGRRTRDWNEEERRRKKNNLKLEFEKEGSKILTSPGAKSGAAFKQISPDDRTALNILDGTSPSKTKRLRPKTRRSPRNRSTSGDDSLPRRSKTPVIKSPEQTPSTHVVTTKLSPSKYQPPQKQHSPGSSPRKQKEPSPEKRLKALSTESLRSVSPGSDSVFYSEVDAVPDHQVHCHHCGKEVEIITAASGSQDSLGGGEEDRPDIVQPPAGFADSPNGIRAPHHTRLYKKLDKRFRSEERHGDRRHYRSRQDTRAKSEERGKEDNNKSTILRPAGSSPCVVPDEFNPREQQADPEQGIYHGFYRLGTWICIANRDVWRRTEPAAMEVRFSDRPREVSERRGSTESEKDFRKKYQAITHRLVHRRSCVEMYRRQSSNSFNVSLLSSSSSPESVRRKLEDLLKLLLVVWARQGVAIKTITGGEKNDTDKTIIVRRESGEFGFRIHGSKPVVVSAIEPDTPAESSGLEVGDIVLSVNGISVIDKSHSEVVKIAHAGSDTLELEVARTIGLLASNGNESANTALYSGYLWRQGGQASGHPNTNKWVRRWFSLRPDHCLYYYKTDADSQPVGAILLTNHNVEHCTTDVGRPFAFRIDGTEGLPLFLAADTDEAANRWVAVMSHASKQTDPWLEMSTRNLRLAPNCVPRPDCFGYLMKLGSRWRAWSKRYCVLKDACLYFYHDGNSKNAFGMACLQGYRVQPTSTAGGKKHAFEIAPPEPKLRHYYFSTESEMDKKRWVAALEYSIDRWMKAG